MRLNDTDRAALADAGLEEITPELDDAIANLCYENYVKGVERGIKEYYKGVEITTDILRANNKQLKEYL